MSWSHTFFVGLSPTSKLCLLSSDSSNYPLPGWKKSTICLLYFGPCPLIMMCFWQMWKCSSTEQPLVEVDVHSGISVVKLLVTLHGIILWHNAGTIFFIIMHWFIPMCFYFMHLCNIVIIWWFTFNLICCALSKAIYPLLFKSIHIAVLFSFLLAKAWKNLLCLWVYTEEFSEETFFFSS